MMIKPTRVILNGENYNIEKDEIENVEIPLSLSYGLLYQLRALNKGVFERYNKVVTKGGEDEFDNLFIIYTAYLCTHLDDVKQDKQLSEVEFMELMPDDREYVGELVEKLLTPNKKKSGSNVPSSKGRTR